MKLILHVELENAALDGRAMRRHLKQALADIGSVATVQGASEGRLFITPDGSPYPIQAVYSLSYANSDLVPPAVPTEDPR